MRGTARDLHEPVQGRHLEVVPRKGEPEERLIRRFVRKVRTDGVIQEFRDKSRYDKPSVRLRKKRREAARRRRAEERRGAAP